MSKWISVKDKLPKEGVEVLAYTESDEYAIVYWREEWGVKEWVDGGFGTGTYDVIAWQKLPKPYDRN